MVVFTDISPIVHIYFYASFILQVQSSAEQLLPVYTMANTKYGIYQDLDKYKDIDADEILKTLTEEELEQLAEELDPDVSI